MSNQIKVFFLQDIGNDEYETESMWCTKDGDNYIIDNIPVIAKRVSLGDTIKVEYDPGDEVYYFEDFVAVSGNTTVRIYFKDVELIEPARKELKEFGCESEGFPQRKIAAVNVPAEVDYKPIKDFLEEGEQQQRWVYEESCLAHEY